MTDGVFPALLEAALRALLAALAVWSALRLLRVRNVPAQKTAWTLMLLGALAMPLLMRWRWLPAAGAIQAPAFSQLVARVEPGIRATLLPADRIAAPFANAASAAGRGPTPPPFAWLAGSDADRKTVAGGPEATDGVAIEMHGVLAGSPAEFPAAMRRPGSARPRRAGSAPSASRSPRLLELAWIVYLAVASALLLRLLTGAISALRLWMTAEPAGGQIIADLAPAGRVRWSRRVNSPVNVGSGIVLPADYGEWSAEKLRVVLAHERAHVRQGDFYLQLFAGFYAALTWFSPLGWWLKRKLSELGEAMGDRAALEEAASPASYAQMLLEFAALPRPIRAGVAMARTGHLASRIERLLNDTTFRQAFAGSRRRAVLALAVVPLAMLASAALVRVQAAGQSSAAAPPAGQAHPSAAAPETGVSNPPAQTNTGPDQQPPAPAAEPEPPSPAAAPNPAPAPPPAPDAAPPAPPAPGQVEVPPAHVQVPPIPPIDVHIPPMPNVNEDIKKAMAAEMKAMQSGALANQAAREADGGEPWALVPAQGEPIINSPGSFFFKGGDGARFYGADRAEIDQARQTAHAPFFWFKHDGKSYAVEDPAVVAQVQSLLKPVQDLRTQMRALGKQRRALGEKLRRQMREQRQTSIPKPDLSKQMAALTAAVDSLKSSQGETVTRQQLMSIQRQIAAMQAQLWASQSGMYVQNGQWGAEMGAFGKQMGQLGVEQGRLAGEMARMSTSNRSKIDAIIQQSLSDGKAKPVK